MKRLVTHAESPIHSYTKNYTSSSSYKDLRPEERAAHPWVSLRAAHAEPTRAGSEGRKRPVSPQVWGLVAHEESPKNDGPTSKKATTKMEQDETPRSKPNTCMKRIVISNAITFTRKETVEVAMSHYATRTRSGVPRSRMPRTTNGTEATRRSTAPTTASRQFCKDRPALSGTVPDTGCGPTRTTPTISNGVAIVSQNTLNPFRRIEAPAAQPRSVDWRLRACRADAARTADEDCATQPVPCRS